MSRFNHTSLSYDVGSRNVRSQLSLGLEDEAEVSGRGARRRTGDVPRSRASPLRRARRLTIPPAMTFVTQALVTFDKDTNALALDVKGANDKWLASYNFANKVRPSGTAGRAPWPALRPQSGILASPTA